MNTLPPSHRPSRKQAKRRMCMRNEDCSLPGGGSGLTPLVRKVTLVGVRIRTVPRGRLPTSLSSAGRSALTSRTRCTRKTLGIARTPSAPSTAASWPAWSSARRCWWSAAIRWYWALRLCLEHREIPEWLFVVAFIALRRRLPRLRPRAELFLLRARQLPAVPRTCARRRWPRCCRMPLAWHHRKTSGTLVGEVNNGVGKVVQTAESLSRELCPAVIQTAFSLVPLLIFSPLTAAPHLAGAGRVPVADGGRKPPAPAARARALRQLRARLRPVRGKRGLPSSRWCSTGRPARVLRQVRRACRRRSSRRDWRRRASPTATAGGATWCSRWPSACARASGSTSTAAARSTRPWSCTSTCSPSSCWPPSAATPRWSSASVRRRGAHARAAAPARRAARHRRRPGRARPSRCRVAPALRMVNVRFGYGARADVLRNFNLTIEAGPHPRHRGTLRLRQDHHPQPALAACTTWSRGSVQVCGRDVRQWPLEQLRGLFSYVSQNGGVFFSGTTTAGRDPLRPSRGERSRRWWKPPRAPSSTTTSMRMPRKYRTRHRAGRPDALQGTAAAPGAGAGAAGARRQAQDPRARRIHQRARRRNRAARAGQSHARTWRAAPSS